MMRRQLATITIATLGLATGMLFSVDAAHAQASGCEQVQKLIQERQAIVGRLNASSKSKQKLSPADACGVLGRLVGNGNATIKFATANMDWCQIPPSFVDNMKADNDKAAGFRNQACNAAKQHATLQRRAQQAQQQQQQGGNSFGGADAVTGGPLRVPQGAL